MSNKIKTTSPRCGSCASYTPIKMYGGPNKYGSCTKHRICTHSNGKICCEKDFVRRKGKNSREPLAVPDFKKGTIASLRLWFSYVLKGSASQSPWGIVLDRLEDAERIITDIDDKS